MSRVLTRKTRGRRSPPHRPLGAGREICLVESYKIPRVVQVLLYRSSKKPNTNHKARFRRRRPLRSSSSNSSNSNINKAHRRASPRSNPSPARATGRLRLRMVETHIRVT